MAVSFRAAAHVHTYYPGAIQSSTLLKAFVWYARLALSKNEEQIALLSSVCSDDINSIGLPKTKMVGPFFLGGLDGYPFVGKTGIAAFSHHTPDDGAALMFFGPHAGITDKGEVGKVVRRGQTHPSSCCGAAMGGLDKLLAGNISPKDPSVFAPDDYQQETIEQILLKNEAEILSDADGHRRFVRMTEVIYREMKANLLSLLKTAHFQVPVFLFGGIVINQDKDQEALIDVRDAYRFQQGNIESKLEDFRDMSETKFREMEAGKLHAFECFSDSLRS